MKKHRVIAERPSRANWTPAYHRQDPDLAQVVLLLRNHPNKKDIEKHSGVTIQTLNNWISGRTRRPYNVTLHFVMRELGYSRKWEKN